ncbi:hypothetical protein [Demequina phytophila]|uniref:hypothetical protein n=1 Tax=Demequina phytophila TaxID=1638981 RepID=UPI00078278E7|nr:hypothetical protein [Demequina phytophila]
MSTAHDTTSLRAGAGLGITAAVMMTAAALLIPGPPSASRAHVADVDAMAVETLTLDQAIDANIAEIEYFIDLGGAFERGPDGMAILDAHGAAAIAGLRELGGDVATSLAMDPAVVADAIAAADGSPIDAATGLATGTARDAGYEVICTEAHGGITLGFAPVAA